MFPFEVSNLKEMYDSTQKEILAILHENKKYFPYIIERHFKVRKNDYLHKTNNDYLHKRNNYYLHKRNKNYAYKYAKTMMLKLSTKT